MRADDHNITRDFYIYTARVSSLTSGSALTDIINIEADANFVVIKTTYFADIAGAAQTEDTKVVPLVNVSILDSGSGRNLQDEPVAIDSYAGRGNLPFILPVPRRFRANSSISVSFDNVSAATDYDNVSLSLIGYKEFRGIV